MRKVWEIPQQYQSVMVKCTHVFSHFSAYPVFLNTKCYKHKAFFSFFSYFLHPPSLVTIACHSCTISYPSLIVLIPFRLYYKRPSGSNVTIVLAKWTQKDEYMEP